jgi:putative transposase
MDYTTEKLYVEVLAIGCLQMKPSLAAWKLAVKSRNIEEGKIFHYGRAIQYASRKFVNVLGSYKKMTCSMIRIGNSWDYVVEENFLNP